MTNARVYNKVNEVQYAKIQTCANIAVKLNITHIQTVRGQLDVFVCSRKRTDVLCVIVSWNRHFFHATSKRHTERGLYV